MYARAAIPLAICSLWLVSCAQPVKPENAILTLKRRRNAVILAHNYQTPEIFHCVADIVGDSLALAREAMKVDAEGMICTNPAMPRSNQLVGLVETTQ